MINVSDAVTGVLGSSYRRALSVESWYGGDLAAGDVPVSEAVELGDRSLRIPERITLTVPREDRGFVWAPGQDADHPLAANGQRLHVKLGVGTFGGSNVEYFQRGVYLIHETNDDGPAVQVTAVNLLQLLDEARFTAPYQPSGTIASTLRALVEPALTADLTAAPSDRSVPSTINFDQDRLGGLLSLLDAWPADVVVNTVGILEVVAAVQSTTPVFEYVNGTGGAVIRAAGTSTREDGFNCVVAEGTATDGGQLRSVVYDMVSNRAFGGPWSPLPVPYFYSSPLMTAQTQVDAAAATVLARLLRTAGATFLLDVPPNPVLQLGDVGTVTTGDFSGLVSIEALTLPWIGSDQPMQLTVREVIT